MTATTTFRQLEFSAKDIRTYLFSAAFVLGNLILPQLCHLVPKGGIIFLPIYFFTLIAAYKFGLKTGLLTAIMSPVANCLIFGMPAFAMLPVILIKSSILAVAASFVAKKSKSLSIFLIAIALFSYQFIGGIAEWIITADLNNAIQDIVIGWPGILIQLIGGWAILKFMAEYGK